MKIGIFMAYMPGVKLGSEGLGRYIGNLIKGFVDAGNDICVACPKWLVDSLKDLFYDFHISEERVTLLTTFQVPVIWKWYSGLSKRGKLTRVSAKTAVLNGLSDIVDFGIDLVVSTGSWIAFCCLLLALAAIAVLLLPVAAVLAVLLLIAVFSHWLVHKGREPLKKGFGKISGMHQRYSQTKDSIQERAYSRLYQVTVRKLIRRINRQKRDVWFIPTLFWPEANNIEGLKVFTAPDVVTAEFPFSFAENPGSVTSSNTCVDTIRKGEYFITYCDYIKKDVLMKRFSIQEDHVVSIPHINNSSRIYVDVVEGKDKYQASGERTLTDVVCRELLHRLPQYSTQREFLEGFDFDHVEYVFYASQQRPHKNILGLIQAYDYLLRKEKIHFKLFLTCDLEASPKIREFIGKNHLEHHVISFKRVPVQLLSALYQCATLVVNPTFYEGGFLSFTTGEGMSVGTPSIMGRIPQVTDMIPSVYPLDHILFDPHDYMDIARTMLYGFQNAKQLYIDELKMYEDIENRTGPAVARDYIKAFEYFMRVDKEKHKVRDSSYVYAQIDRL